MQQLVPVLLALSAILGLSHGFILHARNQSIWNGLEATWGLNPFTSYGSLPRTKVDAEADGWVKYGSDTGCDSNPHFRGERYWKNNDLAIIMIYDPAGYIAGMQAGIPENYSPNTNQYPFAPLKGAPFVLENGINYITAYFVNPATLCNGRTIAEFKSQGTGVGLWIQNGTDPVRHLHKAPMTIADAEDSTWTRGVCFVTMGLHYWHDTSLDMNCDYLFPVFLLYNGGQLNAFGWAFGMEITTSKRFEHPPKSSYGTFMDPVPTCLGSLGTLTTLHIYLTDSAIRDVC